MQKIVVLHEDRASGRDVPGHLQKNLFGHRCFAKTTLLARILQGINDRDRIYQQCVPTQHLEIIEATMNLSLQEHFEKDCDALSQRLGGQLRVIGGPTNRNAVPTQQLNFPLARRADSRQIGFAELDARDSPR